jgi:hypothetical protein
MLFNELAFIQRVSNINASVYDKWRSICWLTIVGGKWVEWYVGWRGEDINPFPSQANPFRIEGYIFVNSARFMTISARRLGYRREGSYIYGVD